MADPEFRRTSRAVPFAGLDPALAAAVAEHCEHRLLGDPSALTAVETHSVRLRRPGLFVRVLGGDTDMESWCAAVVLPRYLVMAVKHQSGTVTVRSGNLEGMVVTPVAAAGLNDTAVTLQGTFASSSPLTRGGGTVMLALPVDDGPAGTAFVTGLRAAIAAVNQRV